MLRKRIRSAEKDRQMGNPMLSDGVSEAEVLEKNHKSNTLFNVPGLFVGLSPKGLADSDSVRSPTSPLDLRVFPNPGSPLRSPGSSIRYRHQKSWANSKVGLSIVDSLDDVVGDTKVSREVLPSSESTRNILVGPVMRLKIPNSQTYFNSFQSPKSLPKNFAIFPQAQIKSLPQKCGTGVLFDIGKASLKSEHQAKTRSCSLDSTRSLSGLSSLTDNNPNEISGNFCVEDISTLITSKFTKGAGNSNYFGNASNGSVNGFFGSLSASEIELSEDYTCVISHGPNSKTTHIYGDCVLESHESHTNDLRSTDIKEEQEFGLPKVANYMENSSPYAASDFLSSCYYCNKKLEEGKDIYIYRGEKSFCSLNCRAEEILIEEMEATADGWSKNSPKSQPGSGLFETGIFVTT